MRHIGWLPLFFIDDDAVRHEMFRLDTSVKNGPDHILQEEKDLVKIHCKTYKYCYLSH